MADFSKYIGLDVHKETIAVAVADGEGGSVAAEGRSPTGQQPSEPS